KRYLTSFSPAGIGSRPSQRFWTMGTARNSYDWPLAITKGLMLSQRNACCWELNSTSTGYRLLGLRGWRLGVRRVNVAEVQPASSNTGKNGKIFFNIVRYFRKKVAWM